MEKIRTIVAAALEDDQLVITDGSFEWTGGQHVATSVSELTTIPRRTGPGGVEDDQGSVSSERIFEHVRDYARALKRPVDVFALSMFGGVDRRTQAIRHVPNRGVGAGDLVPINFPDFIRGVAGFETAAVVVDNDATAAALGEHLWGVGAGSDAFAYVWAGRGVNAGLILGQNVWEGQLHPEAGHCLPRRHIQDMHTGNCAIHGDCILGLASLRSIFDRRQVGVPDEQIRDIVSYYYAQLCLNLALIAAPEKIAVGGYLFRAEVLPGLMDAIRQAFVELNKNYPQYSGGAVEDFIVQGRCGGEVSVLGMLEMARRHIDFERLKSKSGSGAGHG